MLEKLFGEYAFSEIEGVTPANAIFTAIVEGHRNNNQIINVIMTLNILAACYLEPAMKGEGHQSKTTVELVDYFMNYLSDTLKDHCEDSDEKALFDSLRLKMNEWSCINYNIQKDQPITEVMH